MAAQRRRSPLFSFLLLLFLLFNGILVVAVGYAGWYVYEGYVEYKEIRENISATTAPEPHPITFDFSSAGQTGSPYIFGGVHHPPLQHTDAWDKMEDIGVTSLRTDFFIELSVPENITLDEYRDNRNNIQNPDNWNTGYIRKKTDVYKQAKKRGMKTIGIVSYAPSWLTYNEKIYGVPRDWSIYADLVKKHYLLYRDHLDMVEIWNEPNLEFFLQLDQSDLDRNEAYLKIFTTAASAIREADEEANDGKRVQIGGPVSFIPDRTDLLRVLLEDKTAQDLLDFVSYHNYEHLDEPSDIPFRTVMQETGIDRPVYITEWNVTPEMKVNHPYITTESGIPYVGAKFISYLKMGVSGAHYHSLKQVKPESPRGDEGYLAMYYWNENTAELLPHSVTWRLMSQSLGLGAGESTIYTQIDTADILVPAVGFINSENREGAVIANTTSEMQMIELAFDSVEPDNAIWRRAFIYEASNTNSGTEPIRKQILYTSESLLKMRIFLNPDSVTGVVLIDDVTLPERLRHRLITH